MESLFPVFSFNEAEILAFALVLLRVSAFTFTWPIFSVYNVPGFAKILLSLVIAMLIFPVLDRSGLSQESLGNDIAWLAGKEVLTGLCLGFMTRLFFFAVTVCGNLIATSSGMANGSLFNPTLGAQTTTVEQFYAVLATLLFLSLNGHHFFLTGLAQSFDAIPLMGPKTVQSITGGTPIASPFYELIGRFKESGLILELIVMAGIKMAAPVLVAVFVMNVVMGVVSRAVPQVNVLVTSAPVNFMAALLVMIIALPALIYELDHEMVNFADVFFKFMKS